MRQCGTQHLGIAGGRQEQVNHRGHTFPKAADGNGFRHYTGAMKASAPQTPPFDTAALLARLRGWAEQLGFTRFGIANIDLSADEAFFVEWLKSGFDGEMHYMSRHGSKRTRPAALIPGTVSCISVRMNYWPDAADP